MRFRYHLFVCEHQRPTDDRRGCCSTKGSPAVLDALRAELKQRGLSKVARANSSGCLDGCSHGPTIVVYPEGVWYGGVTAADVPEIVESHLVGGKPVERLFIRPYMSSTNAMAPAPAIERK